jgi:hypothetical protein
MPSVRRVLHILLLLVPLGFLLMIPASYRTYTSIGLDSERVDGDAWRYTYVRLRWPGDGSFFVGRERQRIPPLSRDPQRLDPAARFFQPARPHPAKRGAFCLLGEPWDAGATGALWVGMPSVAPFLLAALPAVAWLRRARDTRAAARAGIA